MIANTFHTFNLFASPKLNLFSSWIYSKFIFIQNEFWKDFPPDILFPDLGIISSGFFFSFSLFFPPQFETKDHYPLSFVYSLRRLTTWLSNEEITTGMSGAVTPLCHCRFVPLLTKDVGCVCHTYVLLMSLFGITFKQNLL